MADRNIKRSVVAKLAVLLAGSMVFDSALAQAPTSQDQQVTPPPAAPAVRSATKSANKSAPATPANRYHPSRFSRRAELHYSMVWGVDALSVKWAESGEMIRFSYSVLDPEKAKALNDNKSQPLLNDPRAGVQLVVPSMEQVGQLRQVADPEEGKTYWMAFSNKGRLVKRGDRVDVVIGPFRAEGLVVD
jgi:hypothetical protein